ncbi:MAG: sulfite exporter TauE/SafE family protein [Candidatus Omnitrophica bacterium]|jgi:thiol:disulfide interchange protein DsbD|nr:sulfite exporter TauE/SafE family protein [Candidatus Omnitrophota bacterium]
MDLSGSPLDFVYAFFGGIGMSFTPCVFPLIPVTAGFVGVKAAGSRLAGFTLGFVYVTGVALTYSALGVIASLTGSLFGKVSANPLTHIIVGLVIIIFSLAMFDLFHIAVPQVNKRHAHIKGSYISTFVLGLSSGLVIAPCTTPVLGSILVLLSQKNNAAYGGLLLLCFAYGMGVILILSAAFSTLLTTLPRAGKWMGIVKKAYAVVLLGAGVYFIVNAVRRLLL